MGSLCGWRCFFFDCFVDWFLLCHTRIFECSRLLGRLPASVKHRATSEMQARLQCTRPTPQAPACYRCYSLLFARCAPTCALSACLFFSRLTSPVFFSPCYQTSSFKFPDVFGWAYIPHVIPGIRPSWMPWWLFALYPYTFFVVALAVVVLEVIS